MAGDGSDRNFAFYAGEFGRFGPLTVSLVNDAHAILLEIINFHFNSACFKLPYTSDAPRGQDACLTFSVGSEEFLSNVPFALIWDTIETDGNFGVEFEQQWASEIRNKLGFMARPILTPTVVARDPMDVNRIIILKTKNISRNGLSLETSFENRHIFPGMLLKDVTIEFPTSTNIKTDVLVESALHSKESDKVQYNVLLRTISEEYINGLRGYISWLGRQSRDSIEDPLEEASFAVVVDNHRDPLTIVEVTTKSQREKVLDLRTKGQTVLNKFSYQHRRKQTNGDGIEDEGIIIAGFIGDQIVVSAEVRLAKLHGIKNAQAIKMCQSQGLTNDNLCEIRQFAMQSNAKFQFVLIPFFQKIHAAIISYGRPDIIVASESSLIPLFRMLGFKDLSGPAHHSVIGSNLPTMVMPHQTYVDVTVANPFFWSKMYREALDHLSKLNIFEWRPRRLFNLSNIIPLLNSIFRRGQSENRKVSSLAKISRDGVVRSAESTKNVVISEKDSKFSESKWTVPQLAATVLYPYILVAQEIIGESKVQHILMDLGFEVPYFKSESNWVSIAFFDEFIRRFSLFGGDTKDLNVRAAYRALSTDVLGANYYLLKHFLSPGSAIKAFQKVLPKFNKTRICKVIDSGRNFSRVRITNVSKDLLPKDYNTKYQWLALFDAYVATLTGKPAQITVIKSSFDGDPYCEFIVRWQSPLLGQRNLTLASVFSLGITALYLFCYLTNRESDFLPLTLFVGIGYALGGCYKLIGYYKMKYEDIKDGMEKFEHAANERYKEMQDSKSILEKGYREGKILEMISRELQVTNDTTSILDTALSALCTRFEIRRAFIMLLDSEKEILKTASVFGGDAASRDIWDFSVDVSVRRENPMVLSSVFHTGQSILVPNVNDHIFQLNEQSRRLIQGLRTSSFAIVPVPSKDGNWGVLVADKGPVSSSIGLRDLVVLQRVAQIMGLALDKRATIDTERKLRHIFEKYVPSPVLASASGQTEPQLGGQNKEVICCFVDIRGFTSITDRLAPQILYDILNRFFDVLERVVYNYGGIIDKFIGDGALITWGAVPGSNCDSDRAIEAAMVLLNRVEEMCESLAQKGLPALKIGIGLHRGVVLAGNIGSSRRMEFTVVGRTVNLASRLESLTKLFDCQIVISDSMREFEGLTEEWVIHNNVEVRGVSKPIRIATYKWLGKDRNKWTKSSA